MGSILLALSVLIILAFSPAQGYEISIYSSLPIVVWIFLFASIGISIGTIFVVSVFSLDMKVCRLACPCVLIANIILTSLGLIRGYYTNSLNDSLIHIEIAQNILNFGYLQSDNSYPITHILGASIASITDLPTEIGIGVVPIILTTIFMLSSYCLTLASSNKRIAVLSCALISVLVLTYYHTTPYPQASGILLMPLIMYVFVKVLYWKNPQYHIALLLLLLISPFIHPMSEFLLIICLLLGYVVISPKVTNRRISFKENGIWAILLSLTVFTFWIFFNTRLGFLAERIVDWFSGSSAPLARTYELHFVREIDIASVIELLLKLYGHIVIYLVLAVIGSLIIIVEYLKKRNRRDLQICFFIALSFLICNVFYIAMANAVKLVTWGRMLGANAGIWAAAPIIAYMIIYLFNTPYIRSFWKEVVIITVACLVIISAVSGALVIYRSPWIYQPNWQITYQDISGSNWLAENADLNYDYAPLGWGERYAGKVISLPSHFGYINKTHLGESVQHETYILITERFKQILGTPCFYKNLVVQSSYGRVDFSNEDITRINDDYTVNKLFSNQEFEVYLGAPVNNVFN